MPTITLLDLTMSRDTNGVVAAQVDYTLGFSATELGANIAFAERVAVVRRFGQTDRYAVEVPGAPPSVTPPPGDRSDQVVAVLADATVTVEALGLQPGAATVSRSFARVLTAAELTILLEVGREQAYVVVSVSPTEITSDVQLAAVEIDVGDPVRGDSFDVGGEPVGLAVDGAFLYVATVEGTVAKFDRNGSPVASFAIGGTLSSIGFDGTNLWVTDRALNVVTKLDRSGAIYGAFPTGGRGPVAIAFGPITVWIVHYGSSTVSMLDRDGASLGTRPVRNAPWSVVTTPEGDPLVVSFGSGVVTGLMYDGTEVTRYPVGGNPWDIAVANGVAWVTSQSDNSVTYINLLEGTTGTVDVGSAPKGIAAGAGAVWVVRSLSNELVKVRTDDRTVLTTYAVGEGPDRVVFDGDRVFVANRESRTVTLIRVV